MRCRLCAAFAIVFKLRLRIMETMRVIRHINNPNMAIVMVVTDTDILLMLFFVTC